MYSPERDTKRAQIFAVKITDHREGMEHMTVIVCLWIAATLASLGVFIGALRGRL